MSGSRFSVVAVMPGSRGSKQAERASQLGRDAWALFGRWAAVAIALLHSDGIGLLDEGPVVDKCHA